MNAYELNKIIGAVLAALVFVMGLTVISEIIFEEEELEEPAYAIAVAESSTGGGEAEAPAETPISVLLASADAGAGESASRVCSACHSFDEGMENKIGPALHGVVGRELAAVEGFAYSNALADHEAEAWSYEALSGFLEDPQGWAPGTIMGYAGIKDGQERANVIAYLASVTPDAPAFPEPEEAPAEGTEVAAADATGTATDASEGGGEFTQLVASADSADGESAARVCVACHSVEDGAAHKVGPNVHGVFGRPIAGAEGYDYSPAMKEHAGEAPQWNVETLNAYLEAPMEVVPGTKMAYAGVKDEEQRAAIVAYLHSISPDAEALAPAGGDEVQTAAADATATDAEPAEGEAPQAAEGEAPQAAEGEAQQAAEVEAPQAAEGGAQQAGEVEAQQAAEGEAQQAAEGEAQQAAEGEAPQAAAGEAQQAAEGGAQQAGEVEAQQAAAGEAPQAAAGETQQAAEGETQQAAEGEAPQAAEGEAQAAEGEAEPQAQAADAEQSAEETAVELVEDADLRGAGGRLDAEADDKAVQGVVAAAAGEIADGTGDPTEAETDAAGDEQSEAVAAVRTVGEAEPDAEPEKGGDDELASTIDPDDATVEDTADPVSTGAGTARSDEAAVPAEAASTTASEAVVPEPQSPEQGGETGHTDADVEAPIDGEGVSNAQQAAPAREALREEQSEAEAPASEGDAAAAGGDAGREMQPARVDAGGSADADRTQDGTGLEVDAATPTTDGEVEAAAEGTQDVAALQQEGAATQEGEAGADEQASSGNTRTKGRVVIEKATSANVEIINPRRAAD